MILVYCWQNNGWCDTCPARQYGERTCKGHPYMFSVGDVASAIGVNIDSMLDMFNRIGVYFEPDSKVKRVSKDDLGDLLNEIAGTEAGIKLSEFLKKTYLYS